MKYLLCLLSIFFSFVLTINFVAYGDTISQVEWNENLLTSEHITIDPDTGALHRAIRYPWWSDGTEWSARKHILITNNSAQFPLTNEMTLSFTDNLRQLEEDVNGSLELSDLKLIHERDGIFDVLDFILDKGECIRFTDPYAYIENIDRAATLSTRPTFTISSWINLEQLPSDPNIAVFYSEVDATYQSNLIAGINFEGYIYFSYKDYEGNFYSFTSSTKIHLNQWEHISICFTPNEIRFYQNFQITGSFQTTTPSIYNDNNVPYIGIHPFAMGSTDSMVGSIDEFRTYSYCDFNECETPYRVKYNSSLNSILLIHFDSFPNYSNNISFTNYGNIPATLSPYGNYMITEGHVYTGKIYFRLPNIFIQPGETNSEMWLYYGNQNASLPNIDPELVFIAYDDFTSSPSGTPPSLQRWESNGNTFCLSNMLETSFVDSLTYANLITNTLNITPSYAIEFDFHNVNNLSEFIPFYMDLTDDDVLCTTNGVWMYITAGNSTQSITVPENSTHHFKIERKNGFHSIYMDGLLIISAACTTNNNPSPVLGNANISLIAYHDYLFNTFKLYNTIDFEPTIQTEFDPGTIETFTSGYYISKVIDNNVPSNYLLSYVLNTEGEGNASFFLRKANASDVQYSPDDNSWIEMNPLYSPFFSNQYFQYMIKLAGENTVKTPIVNTLTMVFNLPPYTPTYISPEDGTAFYLGDDITLNVSDFWDVNNGDTHLSSRWQIRESSGDYDNPLIDSGETTDFLTSYMINTELLEAGKTYYWRVKHTDNHNWESTYSIESSFTVASAPQEESAVNTDNTQTDSNGTASTETTSNTSVTPSNTDNTVITNEPNPNVSLNQDNPQDIGDTTATAPDNTEEAIPSATDSNPDTDYNTIATPEDAQISPPVNTSLSNSGLTDNVISNTPDNTQETENQNSEGNKKKKSSGGRCFIKYIFGK